MSKMQTKDQEKIVEPSLAETSSPAHSQYPAQEDSSTFTEAEWALDRAAVRRLDYTVLPLAGISYLLNFLDVSPARSTVHAALNTDLTWHLPAFQLVRSRDSSLRCF